MEDAIRKAAAGFYRTRLGLEEAPDASFLDYRKLADAVIAATDVLPLNSELKTMIQKEKDLLAKNYFKSNSAIYLILNKLLEGRGVKELKNMFTSTSRFQPNAVFLFQEEQKKEAPVEGGEEPTVEEEGGEETAVEEEGGPNVQEEHEEGDEEESSHEGEIAEVQKNVDADKSKILNKLESVESTVKGLAPVSKEPIQKDDAVSQTQPATNSSNDSSEIFDAHDNVWNPNAADSSQAQLLKEQEDIAVVRSKQNGGRRTRSLLKRIRTLTKKNIRR